MKLLSDKLHKWAYHEAKWWQFWYPQSGVGGGLIIALMINILAIILMGK